MKVLKEPLLDSAGRALGFARRALALLSDFYLALRLQCLALRLQHLALRAKPRRAYI